MDVMWGVGVIVLGLFLVAALSVSKKKRPQDQALPKDAYVSKPFFNPTGAAFFSSGARVYFKRRSVYGTGQGG